MRHVSLFLLFAVIFSVNLDAQQRPFITMWATSESGEINIYTDNRQTYNYNISWYDLDNNLLGSAESVTETFIIENLISEDTIIVEIAGKFPQLKAAAEYSVGNILDIQQWGDIQWESFDKAFAYCKDLDITATDVPDLSRVDNMSGAFSGCNNLKGNIHMNNWDVSNVTNMYGMFANATSFNQNIGNWDVRKVETMEYMFSEAATFNRDISSWDVSNVTTMFGMFSMASSFNQDISTWDVSSVENMVVMFYDAKLFNQDISGWNVSNVLQMTEMFCGASVFNQDIGNWDVSKVVNMDYMFTDAKAFNQDISGWDVSNVSSMRGMFRQAKVFNQHIGDWDISKVRSMDYFLTGAINFNQSLEGWKLGSNNLVVGLDNSGISTANYDKTISGWANNPETPETVTIHALGLNYCKSQADRAYLLEEKMWYFYDDEYNCDDTTSVNKPQLVSSISIFPNPVSQDLTLKAEDYLENVNVRFVDMLGQTLLEDKNIDIPIGTTTYDLNSFNPGLYIFIIEKENQILFRQKVVVSR